MPEPEPTDTISIDADGGDITSEELVVRPPSRASIVDRDAVFKEGWMDLDGAVDAARANGLEVSFEDDIMPLGEFTNSIARNSNWWLGDLLIWTKEHFPDRYSQLLDSRGLSTGHIVEMIRVCKVFERQDRLIPSDDPNAPILGLSWTHHHICSVVEDAKIRLAMMQEAMTEGWSTGQLTTEIKKLKAIETTGSTNGQSPEPSTSSRTITITVESGDAAVLDGHMTKIKQLIKKQMSDEGVNIKSISTKESGAMTGDGVVDLDNVSPLRKAATTG